MNIIESVADLRSQLAPLRISRRIALVPTMGCLHEGHLSLIRKARELANVVVVSIYVNPLQFNASEDLDQYPRPFDEDARLCKSEGVDVILHPQNLYPADSPKITLRVEELADCLCGASRPGHFDGVATVVNILFNIVQPDIAVFGEKDWQQFAILRRMVSGLSMPVELVAHPTVREEDGLAMSSRNRYLIKEERNKASELANALHVIHRAACAGNRQVSSLLAMARDGLAQHGIEPEYLDIRETESLKALDKIGGEPARAFIAARIGKARLIDNISLETRP
ncbi:MAG: pantoate--beta-alanine ligase [Mariprofundaceae bacterium]